MRDEMVEVLFDALTDYRCESHADIAAATGWTSWTVSGVLAYIRRPEVASEWGWTVPHVPRGPGAHLFQVVAIDNAALDADQYDHVRRGAVSTLRLVTTENENQAHALELAARLLGGPVARKLRNVARAQAGAAAMTEIVIADLLA